MPVIGAAVGGWVATSLYLAGAAGVVAATAGFVANITVAYVLPALAFAGIARSMMPKIPVAQRQADILELSLGEAPREVVFGRAVTGGTLLDAFNYGTDNEWEVMVIALADHECDALEGYYVNETYYTFSADGLQTGFDSSLAIHWRPGTLTQTPPSALVSASGGRWTSDDKAIGVAHVWVAYKVNDGVWQSGRPRFRWRVRGARVYDPRKDSTVAGGSGAHRYADPATWEWSENAALCRYAYVRGIYTNGQLMVGPGRTADEAPAVDVIADANICDEDVGLKAGGTEKRYRVGCVIRADEEWANVEEDFAVSMGGDLVERAGMLAIDVGAANSVVATITDDDLILGAKIVTQAKRSRGDLINSVKASFVDPAQLWQDNSAPLRRDTSAIAADREPREQLLELRFVTSHTQAQRLSKIALARARLQRTASITLGPKYSLLEVGDWITWASARYPEASVTYQIVGAELDGAGLITLALREIAGSVYAWTPAVDEIDLTSAAPVIPSAPGTAALSGLAVSAATVGAAPAIAVTWTAPTDPTIVRVRIDYQLQAGGAILTQWSDAPTSGAANLTAGITAAPWQVRITPETEPARAATTSSWATVTIAGGASGGGGVKTATTANTGASSATEVEAVRINFSAIASGGLLRILSIVCEWDVDTDVSSGLSFLGTLRLRTGAAGTAASGGTLLWSGTLEASETELTITHASDWAALYDPGGTGSRDVWVTIARASGTNALTGAAASMQIEYVPPAA